MFGLHKDTPAVPIKKVTESWVKTCDEVKIPNEEKFTHYGFSRKDGQLTQKGFYSYMDASLWCLKQCELNK